MQSLKLRHLYGFEPKSVEHWVCLEAADLQAICKLLEMQHLSNTVGYTAQTPAMLFCIIMSSQVWRYLMHFNPLQLSFLMLKLSIFWPVGVHLSWLLRTSDMNNPRSLWQTPWLLISFLSSQRLFIKGVLTLLKFHCVFLSNGFENLSLYKAFVQLFNFSLREQCSLGASGSPSCNNSGKHLQDECKGSQRTELNVSFPKHF